MPNARETRASQSPQIYLFLLKYSLLSQIFLSIPKTGSESNKHQEFYGLKSKTQKILVLSP